MEFFDGGLIVPGTVKSLKYQTSVVDEIVDIGSEYFYQNWGIVLPTGLGKTYIALMLIDFFYDFGSILMLAPTNPLLVQHFETFRECIRFPDEVHFVRGGVPKKRQEAWTKRGIFVATPQTVVNDIAKRRLRLDDFSLIIIDEAHLAMGNHSYVHVSRYARDSGAKIVAMTASPGREGKKDRLKRNLNLGKWMIKTEQDEDVNPYTFPKEEIIRVDKPTEQLQRILRKVEEHLKRKSRYFFEKGFRVDPETVLRRKDLEKLKVQIAEKDYWRRRWYGAQLGIYFRWFHFYEVVVTEGYDVALKYLEKLEEDNRETSSKAPVKQMCTGLLFQWFKARLRKLIARGELHPKEKALLELLNHTWQDGCSVVVFGNSYKTNEYLVKIINEGNSHIAGQARLIAGRKFMTPKVQKVILEDFAQKRFGILVSTTVLELGMHLPVLDALISYSVPKTDISYVQRWGRVGRVTEGKVYVLMIEHQSDRSMFFATRAGARAVQDPQLALEF